MTLLALGINHCTAPLDVRGRFAIPGDLLVPCVQGLRAHIAGPASEAAILSTCNRTELYLATGEPRPGLGAAALDWLAARAGRRGTELASHAYALEGDDASRHAFRVAAGLDSQVLGEPMILGQLKHAVRAADSAGGLGQTLHQLFQRSFVVAKQVRSGTEIGAHSVSLAAVAVHRVQQLFGELSGVHVLFVGAGEMIERVAAHFHGGHPASMSFANRTRARAEALAARFGATAFPLADLPERLAGFDVVVSCTSSPLPLIGLGVVVSALKARRRRPMMLLDFAVPRDIEPEVGQLGDAFLLTLDDLAHDAREAVAHRRGAVQQAEALVDAQVRGFARWRDGRGQVPLIRALQDQAATWSADELARARRRIARGEAIEEVLAGLARGLTGKMLHGSFTALHADVQEPAMAGAVARLFLRQPAVHRSDG